MVLSWRAAQEKELSKEPFDGSRDVYTFFCIFEDVIARGIKDKDNAIDLPDSLERKASEFF